MTLDRLPLVSAEDDDCGQPIADHAIASAWRRHSLAQHRYLSALATAPAWRLEQLEDEADDAARTLRAFGVTP